MDFVDQLTELLAETVVSLDDIAHLLEEIRDKHESFELMEIAVLVKNLRDKHIAFIEESEKDIERSRVAYSLLDTVEKRIAETEGNE